MFSSSIQPESQTVPTIQGKGILRAKLALPDGEHILILPLRLGFLPLGTQRGGQIASACQGIGMLSTQHTLQYLDAEMQDALSIMVFAGV